jgi:hypothetical protein
MKKTTRYTWKFGTTGSTAAATVTEAPPPAATPAAEPSADGAPATAETPAAAAPETPAAAPVVSTTPTFDTLEDARVYLLTQARDKVVRTTETARFHGKVAETMPPGEIRHAIEGALERQRRFPLDTANALRGRLRREHFTIFKKGSKGVSYVCAVKRKFRVPGQTFADSIGALISFIEANPMVRASELAPKFLGISVVPAARPPEAGAPAEGDTSTAPTAPAEPPKPELNLSLDERAKISRLQGDLMWLVREGYVTEFIDGRLFAPPPMVEARKKEIENEEHDPENFPEAPPSTDAPAAPEAAASTEAATTPHEQAASESAPVNEPPAEESSSVAPEAGHEGAPAEDTRAAETDSTPVAPKPAEPSASENATAEETPAPPSPTEEQKKPETPSSPTGTP